MNITIKTQQEFDALPSEFTEYTQIHIQNDPTLGRISVARSWSNASVAAYGNACVRASGNASVEAYGNASVVASGNASVKAYDNASVKAYGNASVEAFDNASVMASGNASVRAYGNASVKAYDNASVVAYGNASVVAYGNASVVAYGNAGVHVHSASATILLYMFSVCWALAKAKITKKSKMATVIHPKPSKGTKGWLESQGVKKTGVSVILFKRVSSDLKTQEGESNETVWSIGETLTHPNWSPKESECGEGKFHACSQPFFCDQFRSKKDDKYIAIKVNVKDLFAWDNPQYPHKIAFKKGTVLYVCDRFGKKA